MTKQELIDNFLKSGDILRVYVTLQGWRYSKELRTTIPYLIPYIYVEGDMIPIIDPENPYFSKRKQVYAMNCYGGLKTYELVHSLLYPYTNFQVISL